MEELLARLRGEKIPYFLVEGEVELVDPSKYPFKKHLLPLQCRPMDKGLASGFAYTSGNRSFVMPHEGGWFKAKAAGIPSGVSRPILREGRLLTYRLVHASIGSGDVLWGFLSLDEARNELYWMTKVKELGLPSAMPVGMGIYRDVHVIELRDRLALFRYLTTVGDEELLRDFKERSYEADAACLFSLETTDIRADELLYALLFPRVEKILDYGECASYLKWLGSSCGYNLRLHHDQDILHGTIPRPPGVMTNSHLANHIVDESSTWMTDYHMAGKSSDKRLKRIELYCLCHVMIPLPIAQRIAFSKFMEREIPLRRIFRMDMFSPEPIDWLQILSMREPLPTPKNQSERLIKALIDGIEHGYKRRDILEVESSLKRRMLKALVIVREKLWEIYGVPQGMQRGVEEVRRIISSRHIPKNRIEEAAHSLRELL